MMPVENISNTEFIKATDTATTILLLLLNEDGTNYDLTDKTITARFLGAGKLLLEKQVSTDENGYVAIRFDEGDYGYLGIGTIQAEIVVADGADTKIFPNDGYLEFGVVYNTKSLLKDNMNVISLQTFEQSFSDMEILANRATDRANAAAKVVEDLAPEIDNMQQYAERAEQAYKDAVANNEYLTNSIENINEINGIYINDYPRLATETTDSGRIQRALDDAAQKKAKVILEPIEYLLNTFIKPSDDTGLIGKYNLTKFKATEDLNENVTTSNNTGQFVEIHLKNNVIISGISFDGGGFRAGGVCVSGSTNVTIIKCIIKNSPRSQAINISNHSTNISKNVDIFSNDIENTLHGVQTWDSENVTVFNNKVNKVMGGLWHAVSRNVLYIANDIKNCYDVGIDGEGGENNIAANNIVKACKYGELAIFKGNANNKLYTKGMLFIGNTVYATQTYEKQDGTTENCLYGGITIHSINVNDSLGVEFKNNTFFIDPGRHGVWTQLLDSAATGDCGVTILDNTFYLLDATSTAHRFQNCTGIVMQKNDFVFQTDNALTNEIKNCFGGDISENKYIFKVKRTASTYLISLYTDVSSNRNLTFKNNRFVNAGDNIVSCDAFNNAGKEVFLMGGNDFGSKPIPNGGITQTTNYGAYFSNQRILALISPVGSLDIRSIPALKNSDSNKQANFTGILSIEIDGVKRNLYTIASLKEFLKSYDGTGTGSGVTNHNTFFVNFSGTSISFPNNSYTNHKTHLDINLKN